MDITNVVNGGIVKQKDTNVFTEIDKHIELKFRKEKRSSRTYIYGLDDYIKKKENLEKFLKQTQQKLATNLTVKEIDGTTAYGFNGNHVNNITQILIEDLNIPKEKINS